MIAAAFVLWGSTAFALERAALTLAGVGCETSQQAVVEALERLDGIAKVQAGLIPGHVLVDHDGRRPEEELAGFVNTLAATGGHCRAAVMRSCITAGHRQALSATAP